MSILLQSAIAENSQRLDRLEALDRMVRCPDKVWETTCAVDWNGAKIYRAHLWGERHVAIYTDDVARTFGSIDSFIYNALGDACPDTTLTGSLGLALYCYLTSTSLQSLLWGLASGFLREPGVVGIVAAYMACDLEPYMLTLRRIDAFLVDCEAITRGDNIYPSGICVSTPLLTLRGERKYHKDSLDQMKLFIEDMKKEYRVSCDDYNAMLLLELCDKQLLPSHHPRSRKRALSPVSD